MIQAELFSQDGSAAFTQDAAPACSAAARERVDANRLRRLVEQEYKLFPAGATADEIVFRLRGMGLHVDYLSIRPRVSELKADLILLPTGRRRLNKKGNTCSVLVHRQFQEGV